MRGKLIIRQEKTLRVLPKRELKLTKENNIKIIIGTQLTGG
jgi:hypothetical protein